MELCKGPQKKLKTDTDQDSSGKNFFCDKQFLHKKQSSCEKVSQIAAKKSSTSNRSLCDKSQTWIVDPLQTGDLNDFNESMASEIKVQSKSLKLFFYVNNVIFDM